MKGAYGWMGKVLRVNLTDRTTASEPTYHRYGERFIGGSGIGYKVMLDEVSQDTLPFDPENKIVFATGPLTGTEVPASARTLA
ncbi:MAG: aldehyde ferredoxin oxidoreductase N-terminal domain-containing protein, partial [Thermodesulfobacteriota bacterium]|nr:aldehyde ferredoxin oxidoreductase N-terminal domain-containing protein [Thermodesulfobacteriota bacterium]